MGESRRARGRGGGAAALIAENTVWLNFMTERTLNLLQCWRERLISQVVFDYGGEERRNYNSKHR